MKKAKILVRYAGREQSLRAWAADNGAESNYSSVLKRWHAGVRDPDQLLMGEAPQRGRTHLPPGDPHGQAGDAKRVEDRLRPDRLAQEQGQ